MSPKQDKKRKGRPPTVAAADRVHARITPLMREYLDNVPDGISHGVRTAMDMLMDQHPDPLDVPGMEIVRQKSKSLD